MRVPYAVVCECGRTVPVTPEQMGGRAVCGCNQSLVVPLKAEFDRQPLLKTASTVPRRIERLHLAGELFGRECVGCGVEDGSRVIHVAFECLRSRLHLSGDPPLLPIPDFGTLFLLRPVAPVVPGRDFFLNLPFRICPHCRASLDPPPAAPVYLGVALAVLVVSGLLGATFGLLYSLFGVPLLLAALGYTRAILFARHQNQCRTMLARVGSHAHLLWQFRAGRVRFPPFPQE